MASLKHSHPGHLNSYYVHLEFSFTSKLIYATAVSAIYPGQRVNQKISRYDPKMPPTTRFFFQVTLHTSKILLFYSSTEVCKNFVCPKLLCQSLCLISSKETAQASLNLWRFTQTEQTKHKGRQLNELSFMNLCILYIYHTTFHLKLSQCVSKILQYH